MKKILLIFSVLSICTVATAQTIKWYVGDQVYQTTTCENGSNITPPTPPEKYGYHFKWWTIAMPIEYLEGNGYSQIATGIDTGIVPDLNTKVKVRASTNNPGGDNYVFGPYILSFYNGAIGWHMCSNGRLDSTNPTTQNTVYTIEAYNGILKVDGTVYNCSPLINVNTASTIKMFQNNRGNVRIYYLKIYQNDILIRDFIPVIDSNGRPCMYDQETGQFYYGGGDYIAGPVLGE